MTDDELRTYLGLDDSPISNKIVAALSPTHRASYERMHQVEIELALWQAGLGPKPTGVLIDLERKR